MKTFQKNLLNILKEKFQNVDFTRDLEDFWLTKSRSDFENTLNIIKENYQSEFETFNEEYRPFFNEFLEIETGSQIQKSINNLEKQNLPISEFYLGVLYSEGEKVPFNLKKADYYFRKSIKFTRFDGVYLLGSLHFSKKDYKNAITFFEMLPDERKCLPLGEIYFYGYGGIPKDYVKAKNFFESVKDLPESNYYLGLIYFKGLGIEKNEIKGMEYMKKAVDLNNKDALLFIGSCYLKGVYYSKDETKGLNIINSLKSKDSKALNKLGMNYLMKKKYDLALSLFEEAAKKGNKESAFILGEIYFKGRIVPLDYEKAKDYLEKSKNYKAKPSLGIIYYKGLSCPIDYAKAKDCFEVGMKYKSIVSIVYLKDMYEKGNGVEKNENKVEELKELLEKKEN